MTNEKQIEEMAKDLAKHSFFYNGGCMMNYSLTAKLLYNAGYRKASDVAREIFAEIDKILDNYHSACLPAGAIEAYTYYEGGLGDAIAELKKKYESEGGE